MSIVVCFPKTAKEVVVIDTTQTNPYLPDGKWTDDIIDEVCGNWARLGFDVYLRKNE